MNLEEQVKMLSSRLEKVEKILAEKEGTKKSENKVDYVTTIDPNKLAINRMGYVGNYQSKSGKVISKFAAQFNSVESYLNIDTFDIARVLDACATEERINILKLLMEKGYTANELMEKMRFSTTGKLYHHLSCLEQAGVIYKSESVYKINGRFIAGFLLILAGVYNVLKP